LTTGPSTRTVVALLALVFISPRFLRLNSIASFPPIVFFRAFISYCTCFCFVHEHNARARPVGLRVRHFARPLSNPFPYRTHCIAVPLNLACVLPVPQHKLPPVLSYPGSPLCKLLCPLLDDQWAQRFLSFPLRSVSLSPPLPFYILSAMTGFFLNPFQSLHHG